QAEADAVAREAAALAAADLPITEELCAYEEALALFAEAGQHDKVGLLRHRNEPAVPILRCGDFLDLRQGPCVPSTGLLRNFSLFLHEGAIVLQMPSRDDPENVAPFAPQDVLLRVRRERSRWGDTIGVHCAADLNEAVAGRRIADVIEMVEADHAKRFAGLAGEIAGRSPVPRIVLIAGPSSAGKTTSCRRLSIHLGVNGLRPVQLSTDDYFVAEADDPIGPDGKPDYEDIRAVDVPALRADLAELLRGGSVKRRVFDFKAKIPVRTGETLRLGPDDVLLVEGIHALNPALSEGLPADRIFRIYLSALPQLGIDDNNFLPSSDLRLVRRIVRDHFFRARGARETLGMWASVRRGEEKWIFPWQGAADAVFDSSLDYEPAVLRPFAEPLLAEVKPSDPEYAAARRLLGLLRNFHAIPATSVPGDSILREYIGGSLLRY
ncbi:MAG: nucleoside kinase, partial [Kiritimatiellae bacterium]|nr:nucleoside kinase [Kiritimatiellia bacterium]